MSNLSNRKDVCRERHDSQLQLEPGPMDIAMEQARDGKQVSEFFTAQSLYN